MDTTMPSPRLTALSSLLGYVDINGHSQILRLVIYYELISQSNPLRERFDFQILGRSLTETNTTPIIQWPFPFHGFPFSPGSLGARPVALIVNVFAESDWLGGAWLGLCSSARGCFSELYT